MAPSPRVGPRIACSADGPPDGAVDFNAARSAVGVAAHWHHLASALLADDDVGAVTHRGRLIVHQARARPNSETAAAAVRAPPLRGDLAELHGQELGGFLPHELHHHVPRERLVLGAWMRTPGPTGGSVPIHRRAAYHLRMETGEPAEPAPYWPGIAVSAASGAVGWGLVAFGGG